MKLDGDAFAPAFLSLLNFGLNYSQTALTPLVSGAANLTLPAASLAVAGATQTIEEQALFTHSSPHHDHDHHHHDRRSDDSEDRYANIGEGDRGMRRPRVGQKTTHVEISTKLQEADECPSPPVLSCSAKADETDSCCVVRPGGVLVHTQFWDLDFGVADSWGIHGLWPDKCNGQYYENCDSSRDYSGSQISQALQSAGQGDLLNYMNMFWVSNDESSEDFWAHEWATHGTCVSTLEPSCFDGYVTAQEVVPYFETVVALFKQYDTYNALKSAGIYPSSTETYALTDLQDAVSSSLGYVPDFICESGSLSSVQYYLNAQGPLQDGKFAASHASRKSECPTSGIKWLPKNIGNRKKIRVIETLKDSKYSV